MTSNETYEFPATPTQEALWFIHRMDPASSAYNIPLAFRLSGTLDEQALRNAFFALVDRHEILRTVFGERAGRLVQISRASLPPEWLSARVELEADLEAYCRESAARHSAELFDLEHGPLVRAHLERFSDRDALLVIVFHHIIIDHLSLALCAEELSVLYSDLKRGRTASLPEPALQFADYTVWREEHVNRTELEPRLEVWKTRLEGFSGVLDLPTESSRPAIQTSNGAELRFAIDPSVAAEARGFARTQATSMFNVLLGALQVLLRHYSRQNDVIVGVPFANRGDQEELERVVGCFVNTLPVATDFSRSVNFRQLLRGIRDVMIETLESQDVPLEAIVDAVKPRRDPSHNPLFQVGFVMQAPPVQVVLEGLEAQDLKAHSGGAMYDLHFWLWEREETIEGVIWYNTDLYSPETIRRMAGHYENVLLQLLSSPEAEVDSVVVPTVAELEQLRTWNATEQAWPDAASVVELFRDQVRRTPENTAVEGVGKRYTYAELDVHSDDFAKHLVARGVQVGSIVGIAVSREADMVVGLLGILKAGAAYLPLDPDYPGERLQYMLQQADVRTLVTQGSLSPKLPAFDGQRILLDAPWSEEHAGDAGTLPILDPGLVMYIIYTSGSTGQPKGVQVTHGGVINLLRSMADRPGLAEEDRLLAITTLSFDIAAVELYLPLTVGATVVIAPRDAVSDGNSLRELLETGQITFMQGTPSSWRLVVGAGWKGDQGFRCLSGGEAFPLDLAAQLLEMNVEVWNGYGPTETTVYSTFFKVETPNAIIPIGTPVANTTCYVLNHNGNPVPIGIPGQLHIGGTGVSKGYLRQPDRTAARFLSNPFGEGRIYQTGDVARFRADGNIEYLGRLDHQVKVRGFRIELGEIESVLARHPAVAEVAVIAREYGSADKRLVAYYRARESHRSTISELRQFLRDFLPDYMIPQLIVELDALPLTPSGKIDRTALPDPLERRRVSHLIPPKNDSEMRLMEIFKTVLGTESVSADSNFFEIGGHSLLAMEVVFHIEREFGVRISPRELILNTLEQLSAKLPARNSDRTQTTSAGLFRRVKGRLGF